MLVDADVVQRDVRVDERARVVLGASSWAEKLDLSVPGVAEGDFESAVANERAVFDPVRSGDSAVDEGASAERFGALHTRGDVAAGDSVLLREAQTELAQRFAAQGAKLDQAEERLQANTKRDPTERAAETLPGSNDTAEDTH